MGVDGRGSDRVWAQRSSEICRQISDVPNLKRLIADRILDGPAVKVWTPVDFLDLASRDAVDKALQRLVCVGQLRRVDRGLYDTPRLGGRLPTGLPRLPSFEFRGVAGLHLR